MKELLGVGIASGKWRQSKFLTLYSFKTPTQPTGARFFSFHWLRFTPTQCLFSISYGLHARTVCFSVVALVYTHKMLVLHWSRLTSTHCWFSSNHFVDFHRQPYVNYIRRFHRRSKQYIAICDNLCVNKKNRRKNKFQILLYLPTHSAGGGVEYTDCISPEG